MRAYACTGGYYYTIGNDARSHSHPLSPSVGLTGLSLSWPPTLTPISLSLSLALLAQGLCVCCAGLRVTDVQVDDMQTTCNCMDNTHLLLHSLVLWNKCWNAASLE